MPSSPEVFDKKRYYTLGNLKFPSVTTILDLAYQKEWMRAYLARRMAEEAAKGENLTQEELLEAIESTRREASDHGDDIHARLHRLGQGEAPGFGPLDEWDSLYCPKILYTEAQVFNTSVGYAGALDIIAEINGIIYLIDLKTGRHLDSVIKLQLAAYKNATSIVDSNDILHAMPKIDKCAILWIPRNDPDSWTFNEVSVGQREYDVFLSCVDIANYHIANSGRNILGKQVSYG